MNLVLKDSLFLNSCVDHIQLKGESVSRETYLEIMMVIQVISDLDQDGNSESGKKSLDYIQNVELKVFVGGQCVKSEREQSRMNPKEFGL